MTENEHTKINVAVIGGDRSVARTLKAHIDLLHELEQYRAIGTVESLKNLPTICDSLAESSMKAEKLIEELKAYQSIGTIDEFKALKEKNEPKKTNSFSGSICNNIEMDWDFMK